MYIPYVTKEQAARTREIPALDYVLRHEGDKVKRVGNGYRLKDHDSLAINRRVLNSLWPVQASPLSG